MDPAPEYTQQQGEKEKALIAKESSELIARANAIVVTNEAELQAAVGIIRKLKGNNNRWVKMWTEPKRALDAAKKKMLEAERSITIPNTQAIEIIDHKVDAFQNEQELLIKKQEEAAREEARKQKEKEQIEAAEKLEADGYKEAAENLISKPIITPPVVLQNRTSKVAGQSRRTYYKWRTVNADAIPKVYWVLDEKKISAQVKNLKQDHGIPGIEVYEVKKGAYSAT